MKIKKNEGLIDIVSKKQINQKKKHLDRLDFWDHMKETK